MPIDSSIPFQALNTSVPLMSMQQHQQNALARQMSQLQMQEQQGRLQEQQGQMQDQQQKREQQNALARAMQIRNPDGTIDYSKASAEPGIDPSAALKLDEGARAYQEKLAEKQRKGLEKVRAALAYADTPEKWDQTVTSMAQEYPEMAQYRGKFTPEYRQSLIAEYAPDLLKPQFKQVDVGGRIEFVDINPYTNPGIQQQTITKTQTPYQAIRSGIPTGGGRSSGGGGGSYPQAPVQLIPAPAGGQPPDGQPQGPVTRRITAPPKGMKLPVGMAWDPDNKMAVPIPGVAPKSGGSGGSGKPMPKGFKLPSGYMWDPATGGVTPAAGSPAAQKSAAAKKSTADAVAKGKYAVSVIDKALTHPGRRTATGLSSVLDPRNVIPGTKAKDFQIVMNQIGGQAFLQAFETLKGGGAISEKEGKKATDAIARLDRHQGDEEFKSSLYELKQIVNDGLSRIKAAPNSGAKFLGFE